MRLWNKFINMLYKIIIRLHNCINTFLRIFWRSKVEINWGSDPWNLRRGFQEPRLRHHPRTGVSARTRAPRSLACACGVWSVELEPKRAEAGERRQSQRWREAVYRSFLRSRFSSRARERRRYRASFECPRWYRDPNCDNFARRCDRSSHNGDLGGTVSDLCDGALLPLLRCHRTHACVRSTSSSSSSILLLLLLHSIVRGYIDAFPREKWPFNCHAGCRLTNRGSLTTEVSLSRVVFPPTGETSCQSMTCRSQSGLDCRKIS